MSEYSRSSTVSPTESSRETDSTSASATYESIAGKGMKQALLARTETARADGLVYWESSEVVDRPLDIDGFPGKVRYIPSFAYRQTLYDHRPTCDCSLCNAMDDRDKVILPPVDILAQSDFIKKFDESFVVCLNNFPYLESQMLLASRQHQTLFTDDQYRLLFEFMKHTQFTGAALQLEGSGATIPEHAHISVFDEELPIFSSDYRPIREDGATITSISTEHPSICYKIHEGSAESRFEQMTLIIDELERRSLSFNLYFDEKTDVYIIPRTNRRSTSANMKVGLSLPAGMYNGYVEKSSNSDIELIKEEIWQHCESMTNTQLAKALEETTVQGENPAAIFS